MPKEMRRKQAKRLARALTDKRAKAEPPPPAAIEDAPVMAGAGGGGDAAGDLPPPPETGRYEKMVRRAGATVYPDVITHAHTNSLRYACHLRATAGEGGRAAAGGGGEDVCRGGLCSSAGHVREVPVPFV
jgi:hypothetical protein